MTGTSGASGSTGTTGATGATSAAATITVNGAGFATIDSNAPSATVQADYLDALESAVVDAHTKASALAAEVGGTLGAVQNLTEQTSDSDGCSGPAVFGASGVAKRSQPVPAPSRKPHNRGKTRKAKARAADAGPTACSLEADVTVTYAMSAS
jgi:uncharacterized protein YggE